ncbi:MAG: hypothetical protein ACI9T7_001540 [Oleiphilaceae bacterium]
MIQFLQTKKHLEQSYKAFLGLLSLAKKYTQYNLEAACHRVLVTGINRLKPIRSILEKGLDKQPIPEAQPDLLSDIEHKNIHGNHCFH